MKAGYILSFIAGAALGALAGAKLMEKRCEAQIQEEIASVKEALGRKKPDISRFAPKKEKTPPGSQRRVRYTATGSAQSEEERVMVKAQIEKTKSEPYVISPDEYGDDNGYEQISLVYYADNTLADEDDRVMDEEEIERVVGMDSLTRFGEYEDDTVFVRNDALKCEYEIMLDQRTYFEVVKERPYLNGRDDE